MPRSSFHWTWKTCFSRNLSKDQENRSFPDRVGCKAHATWLAISAGASFPLSVDLSTRAVQDELLSEFCPKRCTFSWMTPEPYGYKHFHVSQMSEIRHDVGKKKSWARSGSGNRRLLLVGRVASPNFKTLSAMYKGRVRDALVNQSCNY
jgi:hypothetical protein